MGEEVEPRRKFIEENAGYGTIKHIEGIKKFGTCQIHRMSFLKNIL